MNTDLAIAQAAQPRSIADIAASLGLAPDDIEPYGSLKANPHLPPPNPNSLSPGTARHLPPRLTLLRPTQWILFPPIQL